MPETCTSCCCRPGLLRDFAGALVRVPSFRAPGAYRNQRRAGVCEFCAVASAIMVFWIWISRAAKGAFPVVENPRRRFSGGSIFRVCGRNAGFRTAIRSDCDRISNLARGLPRVAAPSTRVDVARSRGAGDHSCGVFSEMAAAVLAVSGTGNVSKAVPR